MGSIMSKIYDDYDDYLNICGELNIFPKDVSESYTHLDDILKERGYKNKYDFYKRIRMSESREEKINQIFNQFSNDPEQDV